MPQLLTPRQALCVGVVLGGWVMELQNWLNDRHLEALHRVGPFASFDLRVMILINESRPWAEIAQGHCEALNTDLNAGKLPMLCERAPCYFDELLIATALPLGEERFGEEAEPDRFLGVPERPAAEVGSNGDTILLSFPLSEGALAFAAAAVLALSGGSADSQREADLCPRDARSSSISHGGSKLVVLAPPLRPGNPLDGVWWCMGRGGSERVLSALVAKPVEVRSVLRHSRSVVGLSYE
jgi:hypothetical protein